MDLKLQIISFTELLFESIDGGWKNQASYNYFEYVPSQAKLKEI